MAIAEVAVTGVGMVTSLGADAQTTVAAWRAGAAAARTRIPELAGTSYEAVEVAVMRAPAADGRVRNPRLLKYASSAGVLGCLAAGEAIQDAGVVGRYAPERVGIYGGAGMSSADLCDGLPMISNSLDSNGRFSPRMLGKQGLSATNPLMAFRILPNMAPCLISMMHAIKGPSLIFTPWEGQAAAAMVEAWEAVATREVDCALAGGADEPSNPANLVFLRSSGRLNADEFAASAAAYIIFERFDEAWICQQHIYSRIRRMTLAKTPRSVSDPMAARMGRMFAAAPAVLLALACLERSVPVVLSGVDQREFRAELEPDA